MDGLRKVPDNIPNKEQTSKYLGYALTSIPDPFKKHESYGHYMNAKLREFLDIFGYIFCSFKCGINLSSSCIRLSKRSSVSATSIEDNLSLGNSFT